MPTVTTTKGKITTLAQTPTVTKIDKDTPIIVASSNFAAANLNVKSANVQTTKSATGTTGITVLPMIQPNLVCMARFKFVPTGPVIDFSVVKFNYFHFNYAEINTGSKINLTSCFEGEK